MILFQGQHHWVNHLLLKIVPLIYLIGLMLLFLFYLQKLLLGVNI